MNTVRKVIGLALVTVISGGAALAQTVDRKSLTLDGARAAIAASVAEARRLNAPGGVIAVVDEGGNLVALERLDGSFAAGATISIGKARTAALFKKETKAFEDIIGGGRTAMVALPDGLFTPSQGGVPLLADGQIVGGIGVSGAASAQQDEQLALAGAGALAKTKSALSDAPVTFIAHDRVSDAFAAGKPLLEVDAYKVHASRREKPGLVEIHERETDVLYVVDGSATLVTGGNPVDAKVIAAGEIRAPRVDGGVERKLAKGDVVVIPQGVPHWFKESSNPFLYFVVKPIAKNP